MKITIRYSIVFLLMIGWITTTLAQEGRIERADKKYDRLAYLDASEVYLKVAESGYKSEELFKKLGNTYYFNANYQDALKWYKELFAYNANIGEAHYYLRYAQSLKAMGEDETAKTWYNAYLQKAGLNTKASSRSIEDYLDLIEENSGRYELTRAEINTEGIDFGTAFLGNDKVVFASTKDTVSLFKRRSAWDGLAFMDLYEATRGEDGSLSDPVKLKGDINTRHHETSATFSKDGNTMYFTRTNTTPKHKRRNNETKHLKIYRAHLVDGKWTDVEDLSINGDNYSNAHPTLSADGKTLYFVSDMPQSLGQTDIFKVSVNADGSLGKVINLGESINTKGRESFPFITSDNDLYFSSDGHYGLGGYDVYYSKMTNEGAFKDILNVGKPINSSFDDIAFAIKDKLGYVSSNRSGGDGYDDIYRFVETKAIKTLLKRKIEGKVTDRVTGAPLVNASVILLDENDNAITTVKTDRNGDYNLEADRDSDFRLRFIKPEYETDESFSRRDKDIDIVDIALKPEPTIDNSATETGLPDLAPLLNIIIYFDLDKAIIKQESYADLEKLVVAMKQYPSLKIDIRSHTDSRGNDAYNMRLSDRRAKATLDHLVKRGISRSRLTAKGYGETQLINRCANGVACSDEDHRKNRRSEFVIITQ